MAHITDDDLRKLVHLSQITIAANEAEAISSKIKKLLNFTEGLAGVASAAKAAFPLPHQRNVFRKDTIQTTDPKPIIEQSPHHEHQFFVVPMILQDSTTDE